MDDGCAQEWSGVRAELAMSGSDGGVLAEAVGCKRAIFNISLDSTFTTI